MNTALLRYGRALEDSKYELKSPFKKEQSLTFLDARKKIDCMGELCAATGGRCDAEFSSIVVPNVVTAQLGYLEDGAVKWASDTCHRSDRQVYRSSFVKSYSKTCLRKFSSPLRLRYRKDKREPDAECNAVIDKRRKGIFGPAFGCRQIVFVDDLSMPEVEEYGAQPPIEIIRQLIDNGGWYDLAEKTFKTIIDTQVVVAMGPAIGGSNQITPRLIRHFSIIECANSVHQRQRQYIVPSCRGTARRKIR